MAKRIVRYVGGPLDGKTMDVTHLNPDYLHHGGDEIVDGWESRAEYTPDEDGDPLLWRYRGPVSG